VPPVTRRFPTAARAVAHGLGLARSILIYYGNPFRLRRMARFYGGLIGPGSLCFDIGAHVGDRTLVFSRLGARVVALEPQPGPLAVLRLLHGRRRGVTLIDAALARRPGRLELKISRRHPTVSTTSGPFLDRVQAAAAFRKVDWPETREVFALTLDRLIRRFGVPDFVKLDIDGAESEALAGLSQPLPALSFEYLAEATILALACVDRLEALGDYRYNAACGESMTWALPDWTDAAGIRRFLEARAPDSGSGDVYARLERPDVD
jgi:FkbM family methyltransferase